MNGRWSVLRLAITGVAAALLACGDSSNGVGDDGGTEMCPSFLPCHADDGSLNYRVPSYKAEIRPILNAACVPCHRANGIARNTPQSSYEEVSSQIESMLSQVGSMCAMPPPTGPQLSTAQHIALDEWLSCGGPNN